MVAAAFSFNASRAAGPVLTDTLSADLAKWGEELRQAGASPSELTRFQDLIRSQSPAELAEWENYLRTAPPDFFDRYLISTRREQGEPTPKVLLPGVTPVTSCEGLRRVSVPDTT